jgi:hypothetical protein
LSSAGGPLATGAAKAPQTLSAQMVKLRASLPITEVSLDEYRINL